MTNVGFTGTRNGMTKEQRLALFHWLEPYFADPTTIYHHGDCLGADHEFHCMIRRHACRLPGAPRGIIIGHIPTIDEHRAFCDFNDRRAPLPYMRRNKEIVAIADKMFATPPTMERLDHGGTWRTVGLAEAAGKQLVIVFPDGSCEVGHG